VPSQAWVRLIAGVLAAAGAVVTWKKTAERRSDLSEDLAGRRTEWGENLAGKRAEWGENLAGKRAKWSESLADKRTTWGANFTDKRSQLGHRINDAFERTFNIDDADSELGWEMLETVVRSTVAPSKGGSSDIAHVIADYKAINNGRSGRHRA
jgi:hypothetical protein